MDAVSNKPTHGAMYTGTIRHRRFTPVEHEFTYSIRMVSLDLETLAKDIDVLPLSHSRLPSLGWFRRKDYHGDPAVALGAHIRNQVEKETGERPMGRILLLTHLRYWGMLMNPIAVFYCYDENERLTHTVLQVTNTPWREKILYVRKLDPGTNKHSFRFAKEMHVSPFNPMDMEYRCNMTRPEESLLIHLENHLGSDRHTDATLVLEKSPLTRKSLASTILRFPHETGKVLFGIYWNAFRLWLKKSPFYSHPDKQENSTELTENRRLKRLTS